jgi:Prophage minor tail protein Z (GPZ)
VIEFVEAQLERARAYLDSIPGAAERAAARALNRAAAAGRETAVSAIVDRYAVQPSDIRNRITLSTASPDKLGVAVVARSGSLALGYFPHWPETIGTGGPNRPILQAEVLRGQNRSIAGAFIAPINGKPRIMIRTGGTTRTGRTQIKSVYTVPFASMLGTELVHKAVEDRAAEVLEEQLGREIDRELGRST